MKILLTGCTGFLGQQLLHSFLQCHQDVIVSYRDDERLRKTFPLSVLSKIKMWDVSKCSISTFFQEHQDIDLIVHTATDYGHDAMCPTSVFAANELFPITLLENAIVNNVKKFINMDTFFNSNCRNYQYLGAYTLSKRHFQEWGELCGNQRKIAFINMRLFHLFGIGDGVNKYISQMIGKCLEGSIIDHTEGMQKRDFIFSSDVVTAINKAIQVDFPVGYYHFDVGRGESITLRDFLLMINKACGQRAHINFGTLPMRQGEPMESCANIEPLNKLGWFPEVSLETGLALTINAYKKGG